MTPDFPYGEATSVPGTWVRGDVACGRGRCRNLALTSVASGPEPSVALEARSRKRKAATFREHILSQECAVCKQLRKDMARVARSSAEARFKEDAFVCATAIFANNDVKYDTNKQRMMQK